MGNSGDPSGLWVAGFGAEKNNEIFSGGSEVNARPPVPRSTKPIARGPFKPKRRKPVRSGGFPPNEDHLEMIRSLKCILADDPRHVCSGRVEAMHLGYRGRSQKAPDETAAPGCCGAHRTGIKALHKGEKTFFSYWVVRSKQVLISDYVTLGVACGTIKTDSLWYQKNIAEVAA